MYIWLCRVDRARNRTTIFVGGPLWFCESSRGSRYLIIKDTAMGHAMFHAQAR